MSAELLTFCCYYVTMLLLLLYVYTSYLLLAIEDYMVALNKIQRQPFYTIFIQQQAKHNHNQTQPGQRQKD